MKRDALLESLADRIQQIHCPHPLRVAIDGVDASGKTTLAKALASHLSSTHRQTIYASVDDFHLPEHIRRSKGSLSPEGFYHDSYDYPALIENLLAPLGPGGSRLYRTATFDHPRDKPVTQPPKEAAQDAILLMDGIFLLRQSLLPYWDLKIYIFAEFINTVPRGVARDAKLYGSEKNAAMRYKKRYVPGQIIYHREANPLDKADILIDNNDVENPEILRLSKGLIIG